MSNPTAAVIFDLFGTLVPLFPARGSDSPDEALTRLLTDMAQAVGADADDFGRLWRESWEARFTGVFPSIRATVADICRRLGLAADPVSIDRAAGLRVEFTRAGLRPRPDVVPTLTELRRRGLRIGLISGCTPEVPELWPETPMVRLIDALVFSCVEGLNKPDPLMYRRACERLAVRPEDCAYVGDGGSHELAGARDVGMRAVLMRGSAASGSAHLAEARTWRGEAIESIAEVLDLIDEPIA